MLRFTMIICLAVTLIAAAAGSACPSSALAAAPEPTSQKPSAPSVRQTQRVGVRGTITRLQPARDPAAAPKSGILGTILVEGEKAADTEADKALVSLTDQTRVVRSSSGTAAAGTALQFADLAVGQRVEVRFAGPVRESYPVQATAAEVLVLAVNGNNGNAAPAAPAGSGPLDERGPGVTVHSLVFDPPRVPIPLMRVRVNDSEPLLFVVDTGWSAPLTLDNWVGEKLKLPKTQDTTKLNGSVPLGFVRIDSIELVGTHTSRNIRFQIGGGSVVPIGDLGPLRDGVGTEERIAGVIGVPLLARATVRFDFAAKTLALFWQPHDPVSSPPGAATTLPMSAAIDAENPEFRYVTLTPVPGQSSARLMIDTGATMTSLPASVTAHLQPIAAYPALSATIPSLYLEERLLLGELRLGDRVERLVTIDSDSAGDHGGEGTGLLGMDLLARYRRVTLDFRNNRLTLEPRPAAEEARARHVRGEAGIGLRRTADGYSVETVGSGSAAARAGVRAGDRVLSVDGVDIAPFSENVADHVLNGFADTPATLVLERPGGGGGSGPGEIAARQTVRFVRASAFAGSLPPRWGVMLKRAAAGQSFVVTRVVAGSPAAKAGLKPGDTIVTLNGAATATMAPLQLQQELWKTEWTLDVRAGTDKTSTRLFRLVP